MNKKIWSLTFAALAFHFSYTQTINFKAKVVDKLTQKPIAGALVNLQNKQPVLTDDNGNFELWIDKKIAAWVLRIKSLNYYQLTDTLSLQAVENNKIFYLDPFALFLEPLEIKAIRANKLAPFTVTNLDQKYIDFKNLGQDLPYLLDQTPSVVVQSDAGNGVGYTSFRIRGTDMSRINITLNGIPFNDAESQGAFFVDLPDFASSTNAIQIQRGVGSSTAGTAAFGATVNLSTNEFIEKPYAQINNSYGSFNTWKNTIKIGSGLLNNHFTLDLRLSHISSDGYIDRASSKLQSYAILAAYVNPKNAFRFNIFSGKEKTYQAWNGISAEMLVKNRTYNLSGTEKPGTPYENETDNYNQTHYQFFYNQKLSASLDLNVAAFLTKGKGYYENYVANQNLKDYGIALATGDTTDLIKQQWLDNAFYGQTFSLQKRFSKGQFTLGGSWSNYDGKHYGKVIWATLAVPPDYVYYSNKANKKDYNIFIKWQYPLLKKGFLYADLQYKNIRYKIDGFKKNPDLIIQRNFEFLNPKIGFSYFHNKNKFYASYAIAHKEPNREDYEANITDQPKPEFLHDIEIGWEQNHNKLQWAATFYYMRYKDQLVLTGKINDVGAYTRTNVPNSFRTGIELQAKYTLLQNLNFQANLTISKNKLRQYTAYVDNWDGNTQIAQTLTNTDIALSPNWVSANTIHYQLNKNIDLSAIGKFVSKQYVDNTQARAAQLNGYYTQDIQIAYTIFKRGLSGSNLIFQVNNIFNTPYTPSGYSYNYFYNQQFINEVYYYPMAGTNFIIALQLKL